MFKHDCALNPTLNPVISFLMQSTAQKGNAQEVYTYRFMMKGRPPVPPNALNVQLFVDNVRPTSPRTFSGPSSPTQKAFIKQ